MEEDIARNGGKSAASEKRKLAKAYIPSGNTRLQNIGVYVRGTRHTPCFQIPNSSNSGIHQVAHAHMMSVTPSSVIRAWPALPDGDWCLLKALPRLDRPCRSDAGGFFHPFNSPSHTAPCLFETMRVS
jgi:hypothetical protein